jgi:threonyl-tRNA synthetase
VRVAVLAVPYDSAQRGARMGAGPEHLLAHGLAERLREAGLRPHVDRSSETVGKKVRAAQVQKAPYTLVIGDKEIESGAVTVRDRSGDETRGVAFDVFVDALVDEARSRRLTQTSFGG